MTLATERAALVSLLRLGRRPEHEYAELVQAAGSALEALERELAEPVGQPNLLDGQAGLLPGDPEPLIAQASAELGAWSADGIQVLTILDEDYPDNLRAVHGRPALLFVTGELTRADARSVAVIGARRASGPGRARAAEIAGHLVRNGYTVNSGLAAGVDTAAHTAALEAGGRTIAVIGTGLGRSYPPENSPLQRRIGQECAVVSQFWPNSPPSRRSFPMRNAVMSGMSRATAVVEASHRSGARIQARLALAQGRSVFLHHALLDQSWARELAGRPGTHEFDSPDEITVVLEGLFSPSGLVE